MIKRAMREVHEYLADREVIRHGAEPLTYQKLLFNEVSGNPQYLIANNFNLLTKKRIVMLIKKSGKIAAFRIGILMPFLFAAAIVIALVHSNSGLAQNQPAPQKSNQSATVNASEKIAFKEVPEKTKDKSGKEVFILVDEVPQFPGGDEARTLYIVNSVKYPADALKKGIQGTVYVAFIVEEDGSITNVEVREGIGGGCDEEAMRVISEMPKWIPGKKDGKPVRVQFNIPIKFALK
jgi:TonB family protein